MSYQDLIDFKFKMIHEYLNDHLGYELANREVENDTFPQRCSVGANIFGV